jgi:hypothetical protein
MSRVCAIAERGTNCGQAVDADSPLDLCAHHLAIAHDWVARDVGRTDALPSPCIACGSRLGVRYPSGWLCAICEWRLGEIPDPDAVPPRVDVVYYIRFANRIKIGTSANPRQRLATLKHDELLAFERGNRQLEQRRHAQFAGDRFARTEWFALNPDLTEHIGVLREGVEDPWNQYALWLSQEIALHN